MGALAERQDLVWSTERVSPLTLAEELACGNPPLVMDIRAPREWSAKHLSDSVNLPLAHLQERIEEVPRNRRIAVHCAGGYRSSIAVSILNQYGITNLIELAGDRRLPHVYQQNPPLLCVYRPTKGEWTSRMRLDQTIVPWTSLWLFYFEEWLASNEWKGGGEHPGDTDKPLPYIEGESR